MCFSLFSQVHSCLQLVLFFVLQLFSASLKRLNHGTPGSSWPGRFGRHYTGTSSCARASAGSSAWGYFILSFSVLFLAYNSHFVGTSFTLVFLGFMPFLSVLRIFHRVRSVRWRLHLLWNTYLVYFFRQQFVGLQCCTCLVRACLRLRFLTSVQRIFSLNLFTLAPAFIFACVPCIFGYLFTFGAYIGVYNVCETYVWSFALRWSFLRQCNVCFMVFIIPCNVLCSYKLFTLALPASVQPIFRLNVFTRAFYSSPSYHGSIWL